MSEETDKEPGALERQVNALERLADATERIADAQEARNLTALHEELEHVRQGMSRALGAGLGPRAREYLEGAYARLVAMLPKVPRPTPPAPGTVRVHLTEQDRGALHILGLWALDVQEGGFRLTAEGRNLLHKTADRRLVDAQRAGEHARDDEDEVLAARGFDGGDEPPPPANDSGDT